VSERRAVRQVQVAVVGFGPVGATLANQLGQAGISTAVFEQATDVYQLPRAAHFDGEIMRIFQSIGLADAIVPATAAVPGMDFVAAGGEVLLRFDTTARTTVDGWQPSFMFFQPDLERALWRGAERFDCVEVHLGTEVTALDDDGTGVTVVARDLASGAEQVVRADWVVGCDGARSFVRRHSGVALDDLQFDQPWLVLDTVLRDESRAVLPDRVVQYCNPARPSTFVRSAGPNRRWEFMLLDGEDPVAMEAPEMVATLLAPWVSVGRDVDVIRSAVYRFHALVAQRWRTGRLLLAGDACHQMPPFLGQGMCSGIRDVANLEWKLRLVLAGLADDELLDTYQPEREPHVRAIITMAVTAGGIISTTDPEVAAVRDAAMLGGDAVREPDLPPPPLVVGVGDHPLVGTRWRQGAVGDDEALGDVFALLGPLADTITVPSSMQGWVRRLPHAATDGATVLLRPDRIVATVSDDPEQLRTALSAVLMTATPVRP
jgi:3-(3-hydroxy-phenyl)propionate hydroxylase